MAAKTIKAMELQSRRTWTSPTGERDLKDPDGLASEAQVMALYKRGLLVIAAAKQDKPFTKGEASFAMDTTSK